jgi:hypothetical protein
MVLLAGAVFSAGWRCCKTGSVWDARVAFLATAGLAAFHKESFAALLPSLAILWMSAARRGRNLSLAGVLRTEWHVLACLALILVATAVGLAVSGANKPANDYSVSSGSLLSFGNWVRMFREMFPHGAAGPIASGSLIGLLLLAAGAQMAIRMRASRSGATTTTDSMHLALLAGTGALMVLRQCAVYFGTGFYLAGRYGIPLAVGLGMVAAVAVCLILYRVVAIPAGLVFVAVFAWVNWPPMLALRADPMRRRAEFGGFVDMVRCVSEGAAGNIERFFVVAWDPRETEELHAFHRVMTKIVGASPYQLLLVPVQQRPAGAEWQGSVQAAMNYYGEAQWEFFRKSGSVRAVFVHRNCDTSFCLSEAYRYVSPDFVRVVLPGNWVVYCRDFK